MTTRMPRSVGRAAQGFTLLEVLLALTLLAMMMGMIYTSLNVGIRAWDAGDARVTEASNWRMVERFIRREVGQIFPTRWRGASTPYVAFDGARTSLRYVTSLNLDAALQNGATAGLQWAELTLTNDGVLLLNRQPFDNTTQNFDTLHSPTGVQRANPAMIQPVKLMEGVTAMEIAYFGAENDMADLTWRDEWRDTSRLPRLIRISIETSRGRDVPPLIVATRLGEEAGCLHSNYTRNCGARPK